MIGARWAPIVNRNSLKASVGKGEEQIFGCYNLNSGGGLKLDAQIFEALPIFDEWEGPVELPDGVRRCRGLQSRRRQLPRRHLPATINSSLFAQL